MKLDEGKVKKLRYLISLRESKYNLKCEIQQSITNTFIKASTWKNKRLLSAVCFILLSRLDFLSEPTHSLDADRLKFCDCHLSCRSPQHRPRCEITEGEIRSLISMGVLFEITFSLHVKWRNSWRPMTNIFHLESSNISTYICCILEWLAFLKSSPFFWRQSRIRLYAPTMNWIDHISSVNNTHYRSVIRVFGGVVTCNDFRVPPTSLSNDKKEMLPLLFLLTSESRILRTELHP